MDRFKAMPTLHALAHEIAGNRRNFVLPRRAAGMSAVRRLPSTVSRLALNGIAVDQSDLTP
jgi:hypothetical protein